MPRSRISEGLLLRERGREGIREGKGSEKRKREGDNSPLYDPQLWREIDAYDVDAQELHV